MEKTLEKHLEETCRLPGVTAAMCVDQNGLCLASKGSISRHASGHIASLAKQASTLSSQGNPVIVIETQNGKTLIRQEDGFTTAIMKS